MKDAERKIIEQAILNEVEGSQFYHMAAAQAPNAEVKDAFLHLAEEEADHIDYLKKLSEELASGEVTVDKAIQAKIDSPHIFNWGALDKEYLSVGMTAFSVACQMERDSIAFYQNAKKQFRDEKAKSLFDILIRWEEMHLEQFSTQYEIYKREWWADQGFSPL